MDNQRDLNRFSDPRNYAKINDKQKEELLKIRPHIDVFGTKYYPCDITMENEIKINRVYIVEATGYFNVWGVWPEDDRNKKSIPIQKVIKISESIFRLPLEFAEKIYKAGESGMGYTLFILKFKDGSQQSYSIGGAVDFVQLPDGKTINDIADVVLHEGREDKNRMSGLDYYWCLYSE